MEKQNMTFTIRTLEPEPSISSTGVEVEAATYEDAVVLARASYQQTKRRTVLRYGEVIMPASDSFIIFEDGKEAHIKWAPPQPKKARAKKATAKKSAAR